MATQEMNRRSFLKWTGAGALALCSPAAPGWGSNSPNILFILADDIGYGDFGCYGATKVKTPNVAGEPGAAVHRCALTVGCLHAYPLRFHDRRVCLA
jgi:hypothetical protein